VESLLSNITFQWTCAGLIGFIVFWSILWLVKFFGLQYSVLYVIVAFGLAVYIMYLILTAFGYVQGWVGPTPFPPYTHELTM
jgi:hypothetical protein